MNSFLSQQSTHMQLQNAQRRENDVILLLMLIDGETCNLNYRHFDGYAIYLM